MASEALFSSFKTIGDQERSRHSAVYDYWLAIRGTREFPSIRELDPLQISDAGPCSILLELIGGGEDAEIRHVGETLKAEIQVERVAEAPRSSLLSCIASKLAIVAISRDALAFEDEFETEAGPARCRVTLLPFSSTGPWVDYVYGFVTSESGPSEAEEAHESAADDIEEMPEPIANAVEEAPEPVLDAVEPTDESVPDAAEPAPEPAATEPPPVASETAAPSTKGFDPFAGVDGFFGNVVNLELEPAATVAEQETAAEQETVGETEPDEDTGRSENPMHSRLEEVRAKADEARVARLQSEAALREGLSAAYDFALDAEDSAEEYLKLVETKGLKIQLRSPMAPVVRLAFDGLCDDQTIAELEAVMAWALRMNLPRGSLAERIQAEGGIAAILTGQARVE
ncbi:hypothetical protein [Sphingomonas sp.]|uniref:hypothetical protein n=1 Tax=Sphingomonas sp. TaxID=28214 RepID=UPI00185CB6AA|nr:hypothetical protein [Sphingomonas sp.]MBA3511852.1 hypothetical protein [Sphingomonas sp.]